MTDPSGRLPLPIRLLNAAGRGANVFGWQPIDLSLETLLKKAMDNTGLKDFGGDEFGLGLTDLQVSNHRFTLC